MTETTAMKDVASLAQQRMAAQGDEARAFIDNAQHMLNLVRQRMLDVDVRHMSARAAIEHRFEDDIHRVEAEYQRDQARLAEMQRRIQAMVEAR